MPSYEPHSLWGIVGYLVVGLFFVAVAWISHRKQNQKLGTIEDQVTNGGTNLRDDLTKAIRAIGDVSAGQAEIRKDIGGLREELRTERLERIAGDQRSEPFR